MERNAMNLFPMIDITPTNGIYFILLLLHFAYLLQP